jgi:hypothetical protein
MVDRVNKENKQAGRTAISLDIRMDPPLSHSKLSGATLLRFLPFVQSGVLILRLGVLIILIWLAMGDYKENVS